MPPSTTAPYLVVPLTAKVARQGDVIGSPIFYVVPAFASTTSGKSLRYSRALIRHQHVGYEFRLAHGLARERRALLEPGARGGCAPQRLAARIAQRPAQRLVIVIAREIVAGVQLEAMAVGIADIEEERVRDAVA